MLFMISFAFFCNKNVSAMRKLFPPQNLTNVDKDLLQAAAYGNAGQVRWCLSLGANANANDDDGNTPFITAASRGHTDVIDVLLDNASPEQRMAALCAAAQFGYTNVVKQLLPKVLRAEKSTIGKFFRGAKRKIGAYFAGAEDATTPLMLACEYGHPDIVQVLLASTEDVTINNQESSGLTALMLACKGAYQNPDPITMNSTVSKLLNAAADVNKQDNKGWTALMYAVNSNCLETVTTLLEVEKIDLSLPNKSKSTALDIARTKEIRLRDISQPGKKETDPIKASAKAQNAKIISLLERKLAGIE